MEIDVIGLVYETLKSLNVDIIEGWYDDSLNKTHITVHEYLETENIFDDDEATALLHNIQLDIWSKDSLEAFNLNKQIRKLMKTAGFIFDDSAAFFEVETGIYHKAIRFIYEEILDY